MRRCEWWHGGFGPKKFKCYDNFMFRNISLATLCGKDRPHYDNILLVITAVSCRCVPFDTCMYTYNTFLCERKRIFFSKNDNKSVKFIAYILAIEAKN